MDRMVRMDKLDIFLFSPYSPMDRMDKLESKDGRNRKNRMVRIDKEKYYNPLFSPKPSKIQPSREEDKSFKILLKSKTKNKHNQETRRRLNFIFVREHI